MADEEYEDDKVCKIYDKEDFFTVFVQILLAAFALASLWIKRMREVPKRKFLTWFLDVSKQALGAGYAHVMNMVIAAILAQNIRGETELEDQCAWYGMSFLIDTTLGLALSFLFLRILDWIANERDWVSLKHSGVYVGPDGLLHWVHQCIAWLFILSLAKIVMYYFMWGFSEELAWVGGILFGPLQGNIRFELLFVMILFPGLMNVIYFWIADSFLRAQSKHEGVHEETDTPEMEDKKESLLTDQERKEDATAEARPWTTVMQQASSGEGNVASNIV